MSEDMTLPASHDAMLALRCECGSQYLSEVSLPPAVAESLKQHLKFERKDNVFGNVIAFLACDCCPRLHALRLDFHKGHTGLVMHSINWRSINEQPR